MPFHGLTINDYQQLTPVATPPPKKETNFLNQNASGDGCWQV